MAAEKLYHPPKHFSEKASISSMQQYEELYEQAKADPEAFWGKLAETELDWFEKPSKVLDWSNPPFATWFSDGKINMSYNCLDRHLTTWRKNKAAIIWEGEPGDILVLTYQELHRRVCRFANTLKTLGLKTGNRAIIYMPMVPQLPTAMLACARLGITHSVVFGGLTLIDHGFDRDWIAVLFVGTELQRILGRAIPRLGGCGRYQSRASFADAVDRRVHTVDFQVVNGRVSIADGGICIGVHGAVAGHEVTTVATLPVLVTRQGEPPG